MNVPLDNLYHYINGLFTDPAYFYLFYPHGSRNILNVIGLSGDQTDVMNRNHMPLVLCNDQEPLNYQFYESHADQLVDEIYLKYNKLPKDVLKNANLQLAIIGPIYNNDYSKIILLHSEKNSPDLELYKNTNCIDVYYWCHAIIAKDWYRFAQYDRRLQKSNEPSSTFLIYCRDWTGTREYRIKFQELLVLNQLHQSSITSIKKPNVLPTIEKFANHKLAPKNFNFLSAIDSNNCAATESANYVPDDFLNTKISVVLETVFDGPKIHLTEKILRPIACGHPFLLAAGPGSLEYLRSYGFKTFSPWLNEDYDLELDSVTRLEKIIRSMKEFESLPAAEQDVALTEIRKIANYNKQWFFSEQFDQQVTKELALNITSAMEKIQEFKK